MKTTGDPDVGETGDQAAKPAAGDSPSATLTDAGIRPDPRAAAFFDLDNTMIQGSSLFYLAKGLYERDYFSTRELLRALWLQAQFRLLGKENPDHIAEAQAASLSFIKDRSVEAMRLAGEEIYEDSIAPRIWPGTRAIAQLHLDAGHQVWLITAAPMEMAETIAARLGITGALGTRAESRDGIYTGQLESGLLHGPAKATAASQLAEQHGFDLARCFAYSDSHNDLPLLSLVGHPCAINPDPKLLEHAELNDWQVRDYRTGRKVAKVGAGTLGAATGAVLAGLAIRRHLKG